MNKSQKYDILQRGYWSADDRKGYLWVIRQDWDFYHEEFYDEGPSMGTDGWAYYVLYGVEPSIDNHLSRSQTYLSKEEAIHRAEESFDSVKWAEN